MKKSFISLTRQFRTSDEWKVFDSGNMPFHDGWKTWEEVEQIAKKANAQIPNEYWLASTAEMVSFKPLYL